MQKTCSADGDETSRAVPGEQQRLAQLALASPLYARLIEQTSEIVPWLNEVAPAPHFSLREQWRAFGNVAQALLPVQIGNGVENRSLTAQTGMSVLPLLRHFRRRISMLIAYRSVNNLISEREATLELTRLAEFCVGEIAGHALALWRSRRGEPWDDDLNRPARFAIIALGKMGGEELNFSSDIDLIYLYEGDGFCRRDGRSTDFSSVEFYSKVEETISRELSAETPDGFLFRVDTRLRPEGDAGPHVRSVLSLENYYATAGQTWERLAWLRARPIAGDKAIAAELIETLQPFRYPRHPPPSLLAEISAMKQRSEATLAATEANNVKVGRGGIREIEFITQTLQLLHAGRFPFLQTHVTQTALEQLAAYDLLNYEDSAFLIEAYWFLRRVEHRIQMREEEQTHTLPANKQELEVVAVSLGFKDAEAFFEKLDSVRNRVRSLYEGFFEPRERDEEFENWWTFFTTRSLPVAIGARLASWLKGSPYFEELAEALRIFVCGDASHVVTREQVTQFRHLAVKSFDALMPALARPALALRRIARFASRYGSRNQFLNTCSANPHFLRALALLFDRSAYACELLCAHPEIFEEVLRTGELQQRKVRDILLEEIAAGPGRDDGPGFARWLRVYIRAEQLRYAIGELFGFLTAADVEQALSLLADAVVESVLGRLPEGSEVLVVALGKYGGSELTFGSDLDLMYVAADSVAVPPLEKAVQELARILRGEEGVPAFVVDARLRPHGEAGPLVLSVAALRAYHDSGSAQTWEKQLLTRARVVCGPKAIRTAFEAWCEALLFCAPLAESEIDEIRAMRLRIERERDIAEPRQRAFKVCAGGLVDFEFFAQVAQLREGWKRVALRKTSTRAVMAALRVPDGVMENYDFLKRVEIAVRRDENEPVSVLPMLGSEEFEALARWLGFPSGDAFWGEHVARLAWNREALFF